MFKVKNTKIINKLVVRILKGSKMRNIIAMIAIAMTTVLFTTLFSVGSGMMESFQNQSLRMSGGKGQVAFKYIDDDQFNKIKNHPLIDRISYNKIISESVDNKEFLKRKVEMYYVDDNGLDFSFIDIKEGKKPSSEDEIIMDTKSLKLLGIKNEVGEKVPLEYTVNGKHIKKEFTLSGYWISDSVMPIGFAMVSEEYMKAIKNEIKDGRYASGKINAYAILERGNNLEQDMFKIIHDSGYTVKTENNEGNEDNEISCNVNWAYLSSNFSNVDTSMIIGALGAILLIMFTGYLIIYNIFQISVVKDIKLFGLFKTIGITSKQIKKIVFRQGLVLWVVSYPIGALAGILLGKIILPIIMKSSVDSSVYLSLNPYIFVLAGAFSLFTVFLSVRKPGKKAAKITPVEAAKYTGCDNKKKKNRKSSNGNKIWRLALANISRNRKRTVTAVLSMTLSLVLLNSTYTISNGFNMDKFVSKFVSNDFMIGHANYFNNNHFRFQEEEVSSQLINRVENRDGFEVGGRLYKNIAVGDCTIITGKEEVNHKGRSVNKGRDGNPMLSLYGADEFIIENMDVVDGNMDINKLKTGKYILQGIHEGDNGELFWDRTDYKVGDKVNIKVDEKEYEYEILADIRIKSMTLTNRMYEKFEFYLPTEEYKKIVSQPVVMNYAFNVKSEKEEEMEIFLKNYTEKKETLMHYESKTTYFNQFEDLKNMFNIVGGVLALIVGMIGILNFFNSIFTSIWSRRYELAMLESVGMTKDQTVKMLSFEGIYYSAYTIIAAVILGTVFSQFVIKGIFQQLWFFSYSFEIRPMMFVFPFIVIISILTPRLVFGSLKKESVVERLRAAQ